MSVIQVVLSSEEKAVVDRVAGNLKLSVSGVGRNLFRAWVELLTNDSKAFGDDPFEKDKAYRDVAIQVLERTDRTKLELIKLLSKR